MFKKILVATDGSSHAAKAAKLASGLAKSHDAEMVIVHVLQHGGVPDNIRQIVENEHLVEQSKEYSPRLAETARGLVAVMGDSADNMDTSHRVFHAYGEHILARTEHEAHLQGAHKTKTVVEDGDPVECILECANRENADLIVMGTRGLSNLKGVLMGSVSHKVIQLAPCTCVSVK